LELQIGRHKQSGRKHLNFENRYLDVTAISPETVYRFSNNRYTSENLTFRRFNIQGTSVIRLLAEETPPSPLIAATDPKQQLNTILMSWRQRLNEYLRSTPRPVRIAGEHCRSSLASKAHRLLRRSSDMCDHTRPWLQLRPLTSMVMLA